MLGTILLHSEKTVNKSVMKANEFNMFRIVVFLGYFAFVGFSLMDAQIASLCPFYFLVWQSSHWRTISLFPSSSVVLHPSPRRIGVSLCPLSCVVWSLFH